MRYLLVYFLEYFLLSLVRIPSYFVLNQSNNPQIYNCGVHFDPQSAAKTNVTQDVNDTTVKFIR
jgi:hypothetical protein